MTPHQKAIEAAIDYMEPAFRRDVSMGAIKGMFAVFLASARESGSDMMPREPTSAMKQAQFYRISNDGWREMFDAAPRFEDAP